jgi:hypothetical protein
MVDLFFERTCNYWIDAGIVGFYDTLNKPLPSSDNIGEWQDTIKKHTGITTDLQADRLILSGNEHQINLALSYALESVRTTLYDVSSENQINTPELDGRIKQMSTPAGEVVASGKQAEYTYFRKEIIQNIGRKEIFWPLKKKMTKNPKSCTFCGNLISMEFPLKEANEIFVGDTKKSTPFIEGESSNRCFHSLHSGSEKCWQCGYLTFFAPLLLFYRKQSGGDDTYYALPHIPGNLNRSYQLYRNLSGKRGLALVTGTDHTSINYESNFAIVPKGIPCFILIFYFDLFQRLMPKNVNRLRSATESMGLVDSQGQIFQIAVFLKRDSGQKSFILRETTVDKSAYFIKLFSFLTKQFVEPSSEKLKIGLASLIKRASSNEDHRQRISVIRACQALTEGKHIYRFLLPIIVSSLKEEQAPAHEIGMIIRLFLKYDQWLFRAEENEMSKMVENAKNAGWHLSETFWNLSGMEADEKKNLIKRYYYNIERSASPVKFLEHARLAHMRAGKEIPKEMDFHNDDGTENIKKFEAYRVYFLAGMLNGFLKKNKSDREERQAIPNEVNI